MRFAFVLAIIFLLVPLAGRAQDVPASGTFRLTHLGKTGILRDAEVPLDLCRADRVTRIGPVDLHISPQYYALSADGCRSVERAITREQLATAQSLGLIATRIPPEPGRIQPQAGAFAAAGLILLTVLVLLIRRARRRRTIPTRD